MSKTNDTNLFSTETVSRLASELPIKGKGIASTGWDMFDTCTGGFHNGDLIVVSGFSNMGKTTFIHNLIKHICVEEGLPVLYFSFQTLEAEIVRSLVASIGHTNYPPILPSPSSIGENKDKEAEFDTRYTCVFHAPIHICNEELDERSLCEVARNYVRAHGIKAIFIDGFYNIKGACSADNVQDQIFRSLKALALHLDLPVIVTHTYKSSDRTNDFSRVLYPKFDLAIYNPAYDAADLVLVLNRPELLGVRIDNNGHDLRGVLFVGIDKDCRGREGVLPLRYSRSSKTIWEDDNMPWPLEL